MSRLGASLTGLAGTFLGDMDEASRERALEGAALSSFRSGERIFADGYEPRIGIVIEGIARSYMVGTDGRQLTLRYIRPPALLTTASTAIAIQPVPISNQAVTDVTMLELDQPVLVELFAQDTRVAFAWANELARRFTDVYRSFAATFFGSFAERLATHVLHAAEPVPGRGLFANVSQAELAEALGSAREVVGRTLRQWQSEGLVKLSHRGVAILDVSRLVATAGPWGSPPRLYTIDVSGHTDESFEKLAQPVVGMDTNLTIVYANPAVPATFGTERGNLIGRSIGDLVDDNSVEALRSAVAQLEADPTPRTIALPTNLSAKRPDQSEFPVEIVAVPVHRRDVLFVFATLVDVSYRQALRDLVARKRN